MLGRQVATALNTGHDGPLAQPALEAGGGGRRVLATLTQPTFGFQERKKDRVCYFPATHSSFLCDVCTVRHTR